jgi:hypothetical protein
MASGVYNILKSELMKKNPDLVNDTVWCALLDNSHSFSASSTVNDQWTDVSANEIAAGGGYSTNGTTLSNMAVTCDDVDNEGVWDADDVTWSSSTITAYHAVLWDDTVTSPADMLICSIDFGGEKSSNNGDFTIQWDSEGIINIT